MSPGHPTRGQLTGVGWSHAYIAYIGVGTWVVFSEEHMPWVALVSIGFITMVSFHVLTG